MTKADVISCRTDNSGSQTAGMNITGPPFNLFFDSSPIGYFILSGEGLILKINNAASGMAGLKSDDMIGNSFTDIITTGDRNHFIKCWLELTDTGRTEGCEIRFSSHDSLEIWLKLNLFKYETGNDHEILVTATDITFDKEIENVQSFLLGFSWIKSGKDFFEALAEYLAVTLGMDYVCIDRLLEKNLEAQTVAIYYDGKFEENVRYTLKDTPCGKVVEQKVCFYPNNVSHIFPNDAVLQEMAAESYAGITLWGSNDNPIGLIAAIGRKSFKNRELVEMLLKQVSIRAASELEYRQMQETISNSQKELEVLVEKRTRELRKTEEKYRTVADFTYDWETWVGPDGKFIYVSPSCMRTTGYTVEEFMNDPLLVVKIAHPDDREIVENHYKDKRRKYQSHCSVDFRIITRDGTEKWIGHSCQPVFNDEGKWIGQRGSNRDITAWKKTESNLLTSHLHLRALTKRMDAIAEEERTRISREIHDELGHLLTALKFDIQCLNDKSSIDIKQLRKELASMTCMLDSLIDSVRKIATDLRPGILDHFGLCPAIEWQIEQFKKRTGIKCEYSIIDTDINLNNDVVTTIYRILQEILTNISRHSKATKVSVSLSQNEGKLLLTVADNGIGFEVRELHDESSLGLMGMYERALSIGGQLKIESVRSKGTIIGLELQLNK